MFSAARSAGLTLGVLVTLAACAAAPPASTPTAIDAAPALAPAMTIERFLRAVNQNDLDTMASLFGTRDGSVARTWSRQEVDDRMFLLASLLRHTDYAIAGERIVPGRRDEATQMDVQLVVTAGPVVVPFTLVLTRNRQWLIEQVGIERITHPGRQR
jgi:hypothetical protein